jgi:hypothetical protein
LLTLTAVAVVDVAAAASLRSAWRRVLRAPPVMSGIYRFASSRTVIRD